MRAATLAAAIGCAFLISGCEQSPQSAPTDAPAASTGALPAGKGFDFYVLALSWSPSYCEAAGENANQQQCRAQRPYAFVVHGLWPQFERGYPEDCATSDPKVANETIRPLYDLMPSAGLIRHEWKQHGACTGLSQEEYFRVLRAAREKVQIPDQFQSLDDYLTVAPRDAEAAFLKSNAGLSAEGIAVTCDKRYLREVRICMTKDLQFRSCPEIDRRECRLDKTVMPPVRSS